MPILSTASNLKVVAFTVSNLSKSNCKVEWPFLKFLNQEKMYLILPLFFICFTRATRPIGPISGQGLKTVRSRPSPRPRSSLKSQHKGFFTQSPLKNLLIRCPGHLFHQQTVSWMISFMVGRQKNGISSFTISTRLWTITKMITKEITNTQNKILSYEILL